MASGVASSNIPAALKKQLAAAEKFFADGNLRSARMHADLAKNLFPCAVEAQRAHAAYKVHIAAADRSKPDYYAVLGVTAPLNGKPSRETHDAVKSQHRALCDLLGPAKNSSSSAAAGAYKLVNEAFATLTDIKKNEAAGSANTPPPRPRLPPLRPVLRPKVRTARGGPGFANGVVVETVQASSAAAAPPTPSSASSSSSKLPGWAADAIAVPGGLIAVLNY